MAQTSLDRGGRGARRGTAKPKTSFSILERSVFAARRFLRRVRRFSMFFSGRFLSVPFHVTRRVGRGGVFLRFSRLRKNPFLAAGKRGFLECVKLLIGKNS